MKIGKLKLKNRFFLAPMLEPNDIVFRILCKSCGCGLTFTGMKSPLSKENLILDDKPCLQLFGNNSKGIKSFIKKHDSRVSMWDFNLGCPSNLSEKLCHGAFMHDDLESIKDIFSVIRKSTKKPCCVKLRKSENAIEIAKLAESCGFDAVTIHPRTIEQGYSGKSDYDFALKLKSSVSIPVIYSGDVNENNFKKILSDFNFVMIGRRAIGNPNLFSVLTGLKKRVGFKDYLELAKEYNIDFKQIKFQALCFTKGLRNASKMRERLVFAKSVEDINRIYGL